MEYKVEKMERLSRGVRTPVSSIGGRDIKRKSRGGENIKIGERERLKIRDSGEMLEIRKKGGGKLESNTSLPAIFFALIGPG
ncbi:MAG: hypothetical protein GY940_29525 [bacterium]|nr:hypothetical protein [bacterium]